MGARSQLEELDLTATAFHCNLPQVTHVTWERVCTCAGQENVVLSCETKPWQGKVQRRWTPTEGSTWYQFAST